MPRLFRVPIVLLFAALGASGAYGLGFRLLPDSFDIALVAAAVAAVVVTVIGLGSLTRVVGIVLLGLPITVAALATPVYVAGMAHVDRQPRFAVVVATARCTATHLSSGNTGIHRLCDHYAFTFTDTAGKPAGYRLDNADARLRQSVGSRLDVYQRAPGAIKLYPTAMAEPLPQVRRAAHIAVPVFMAYVVLAALVGMVAGRRRRAPAAADR